MNPKSSVMRQISSETTILLIYFINIFDCAHKMHLNQIENADKRIVSCETE